jgi:alkylated DNA repair dioxygenase AlkB
MNYSIDITNELDGTNTLLIYVPNFLNQLQHMKIFNHLQRINDWKDGFVNDHKIKRQQKWFNLNGNNISDNWKETHDRWQPNKYYEWLLELQNNVYENVYSNFGSLFDRELAFNSVLINKYITGDNFISAHRDSEYIFGNNPIITSLSIGDDREFILRRVHYDKHNPKKMKLNKHQQHLNKRFTLKGGSLIIMAGSCQKYYSHEVPKSDSSNVRYNFTFRNHV